MYFCFLLGFGVSFLCLLMLKFYTCAIITVHLGCFNDLFSFSGRLSLSDVKYLLPF